MLLHDLRFGIRLLVRNPSFAFVAIATFALGIGATTAMFTIVDGVLVRPLPYRDPDRLVLIRADVAGFDRVAALTAREIEELRHLPVFEGVAVIRGVDASLTDKDDMEAVAAASVTDDLLPLLGARPYLGRLLSEREDLGPQFVRAVEVSYDLWQRRWHGDPSLVGRHIEVNNIDVVVAGIMPRGFSVQLGPGTNVPADVDIWFPTNLADGGTGRGGSAVVARLSARVTLVQADHAANAVARQLLRAAPGTYPDGRLALHLIRLQDDLVQEVRPTLLALFGAVAFVLVIACANIAQLLLARSASRSRELAVRQAIGAERSRLVRQLVTEGLLIALLGAGVGFVLAQWGVAVVVGLAPDGLPHRDAISLDLTALAFTLGAALVSALVFGVAPAVLSLNADVVDALKAGALKTPEVRQMRLRGLLMVVEVALSLALLVGAGLLMRTLVALNHVTLGFRSGRVLTLSAPVNFRAYPDRLVRTSFYLHAWERVRALPAVNSASLIFPVPLRKPQSFQRYGVEADGDTTDRVATAFSIGPGYFETMSIRLVAGRDFSWEDVTQDRAVVIVDERFAQESWPGRALGEHVLLQVSSKARRSAKVIGVAAHVQADGLRGPGLPQLYRPFQMFNSNMAFVIRTRGNPVGLSQSAKTVIESLGPGRPVRDVRPMEAYVRDATAENRFALVVLSGFALAALVLAAVGLYGVISYVSAGRTRELGIRIALGAEPSSIAWLVVSDGLRWTIAGIGVGVMGAAAVTHAIRALLFGVTATDPMTFLAVVALMVGVAVGASYLPARRASRVDPVTALQSE